MIAKYTHWSQANPHYKDKFTMCIGGATYTRNNCKAVINRALNLNKEVCLTAAALNSNAQSTSKTGVVNLNYQPNYFALFWPEQIQDIVQFMENDKFIKPGSQLWLDLREQAVVMAKTCYAALGLDTLSSQKLHVESEVFKWPLDNENQIHLSDLEQEKQVSLQFFIKNVRS